MENEFMNRGYLLPDGCKDLMDAWQPQGPASDVGMMPMPHVFTPEEWKTMRIEQLSKAFNKFQSMCKGKLTVPALKGELIVPAQMSALQLATMLNQNMSRIFADLLEIGGVAAVKEQLDFETIAKIARKYGFIAKKEKE